MRNNLRCLKTALTLMLALALLSAVGLSGCAPGDKDEPSGTVTDPAEAGTDPVATEEPARKTALSDLFGSGDKYSYKVELVHVLSCPGQGTYRIAQGAASDGNYVYFVMRQSENGDCIICKYSLKTKKLVRTSEPIHLYHGNDMTYNSKTGLLYVSHGSSEGKILTSVDPETLEPVKKSINIEKGSGAITYNESRDCFAISQGGKTLHFLDSKLKLQSSFERTDKTGFTAQGMGSDDTYIYFPMSSSDCNIIVAYDWEGNYVEQYLLDFAMESETLFWVNDTYYIVFNNGGAAQLYSLEITAPDPSRQ